MSPTRSSEDAIRATLAGYCQYCDDGRFDAFADLFTVDARVAVMGRVYEGRDAIRTFMERAQPPERRGKHLLGASLIEVDNSDGGHARAWSDYVFVARSGDAAFAITSAGRYHDELVVDGDVWRIRRREIVFVGEEPQPDPG